MTNITARNVLRLYWSTSPALVGYPQSREQMLEARAGLLAGKPAFRGSARRVLDEMQRVRQSLGGTFVSFFIQAADGRDVDVGELREVVWNADIPSARR
jgi:hypothetical protein